MSPHDVSWDSPAGGSCTITVTLHNECFMYSGRDFLMAVDAAIDEIEDVFAKEYKRRTGKGL